MKSAFIYNTLIVIIPASDVGCHICKMDRSYEMAYQIKVAITALHCRIWRMSTMSHEYNIYYWGSTHPTWHASTKHTHTHTYCLNAVGCEMWCYCVLSLTSTFCEPGLFLVDPASPLSRGAYVIRVCKCVCSCMCLCTCPWPCYGAERVPLHCIWTLVRWLLYYAVWVWLWWSVMCCGWRVSCSHLSLYPPP